MITSNLPFSNGSVSSRTHDDSGSHDRLVHHSIILELNLPSYRLEHSTANKEVRVEVESQTMSTEVKQMELNSV